MMEPNSDPIVPKPNETSIEEASSKIFLTSCLKLNDFWFHNDNITEAGSIKLHDALDNAEFRTNESWLKETKALLNAKLFRFGSRNTALKRPFELALDAAGMKRPIEEVFELDEDAREAIFVAREAIPPLITEDEARDEKGIRMCYDFSMIQDSDLSFPGTFREKMESGI